MGRWGFFARVKKLFLGMILWRVLLRIGGGMDSFLLNENCDADYNAIQHGTGFPAGTVVMAEVMLVLKMMNLAFLRKLAFWRGSNILACGWSGI